MLASNGYTDTSMGGGTKLLRLQQNGCAGALTDGRLRDFDELARYDFAACCSGEATRWGGDRVTPFQANVSTRGAPFAWLRWPRRPATRLRRACCFPIERRRLRSDATDSRCQPGRLKAHP